MATFGTINGKEVSDKKALQLQEFSGSIRAIFNFANGEAQNEVEKLEAIGAKLSKSDRDELVAVIRSLKGSR
jgi:hypothetical protein